MEQIVLNLTTGLGGAVLALVGVWAVAKVQRKAANTEHAFGVSDRWQSWALKLEARVSEGEKEIERLKGRITAYETTINAALGWVEKALALLDLHNIKHPPLPDAVARLLKKRNEGTL